MGQVSSLEITEVKFQGTTVEQEKVIDDFRNFITTPERREYNLCIVCEFLQADEVYDLVAAINTIAEKSELNFSSFASRMCAEWDGLTRKDLKKFTVNYVKSDMQYFEEDLDVKQVYEMTDEEFYEHLKNIENKLKTAPVPFVEVFEDPENSANPRYPCYMWTYLGKEHNWKLTWYVPGHSRSMNSNRSGISRECDFEYFQYLFNVHREFENIESPKKDEYEKILRAHPDLEGTFEESQRKFKCKIWHREKPHLFNFSRELSRNNLSAMIANS